MASIHYRTSRGTWEVRWKELEQVQGPDGAVTRRWVSRRRQVPLKRDAERLARDVEGQVGVTGTWAPTATLPIATIGSMGTAYLAAMLRSGEPSTTTSGRGSLLQPFLAAHEGEPVSSLTVGLLRAYAATLPAQGRQASTRHRRILEIERMWMWASMDRGSWPGLEPASKITGVRGEVRPPPPVVATAAPSWADVDAMVAQLGLAWHRRAALVMRYTGLRVSQVVNLRWEDVDLRAQRLVAHAAVRGSKGGRARVLPLAPPLAAELASWEPAPTGLLFPRRYHDARGRLLSGAYRGDALVEPFRAAWEAAKVPRERWDIPEHGDPDLRRGHGSPTHAIRRCIRSGLLRLGVEEPVALYLVGQSQGLTAAAYVPETCPEQSPWWEKIVAAVKLIPEHQVMGRRS